MLRAVPPMPVMIHLMDLPSVPVADVKEPRHACIGADGHTRVDRVDVTGLGKDLELHELLGHLISRCNGRTPAGRLDAVASK